MEYSLQVGIYRQLFGKIGEISPAYMTTYTMNSHQQQKRNGKQKAKDCNP